MNDSMDINNYYSKIEELRKKKEAQAKLKPNEALNIPGKEIDGDPINIQDIIIINQPDEAPVNALNNIPLNQIEYPQFGAELPRNISLSINNESCAPGLISALTVEETEILSVLREEITIIDAVIASQKRKNKETAYLEDKKRKTDQKIQTLLNSSQENPPSKESLEGILKNNLKNHEELLNKASNETKSDNKTLILDRIKRRIKLLNIELDQIRKEMNSIKEQAPKKDIIHLERIVTQPSAEIPHKLNALKNPGPIDQIRPLTEIGIQMDSNSKTISFEEIKAIALEYSKAQKYVIEHKLKVQETLNSKLTKIRQILKDKSSGKEINENDIPPMLTPTDIIGIPEEKRKIAFIEIIKNLKTYNDHSGCKDKEIALLEKISDNIWTPIPLIKINSICNSIQSDVINNGIKDNELIASYNFVSNTQVQNSQYKIRLNINGKLYNISANNPTKIAFAQDYYKTLGDQTLKVELLMYVSTGCCITVCNQQYEKVGYINIPLSDFKNMPVIQKIYQFNKADSMNTMDIRIEMHLKIRKTLPEARGDKLQIVKKIEVNKIYPPFK